MPSFSKPRALLLDVNETMFSLQAFRGRLESIGLVHKDALELWFASILRDGIAITASGHFATFKAIAHHAVEILMAQAGLEPDADKAASVLQGFDEVSAHPDVLPGLVSIRKQGIPVATMTNGSKAVTQKFLTKSNLEDLVSLVLDVEGPQAWKPAKEAYLYAVQQLGFQASEVMLVAVHPWDCHGAKAAGLQGAFIARNQESYPAYCLAPDLTAGSFEDLARQLG